MDEGTLPVREFPSSRRYARPLIPPTDSGNPPTRLLYCRDRLVRRDRAPMLEGREPDSPRPCSEILVTDPELHRTPPQLDTEPEHTAVDGLDPEHCQPERPYDAGSREAARSHSASSILGELGKQKLTKNHFIYRISFHRYTSVL